MTDNKFTDDEVIKALECCGSSDDRVSHCKGYSIAKMKGGAE